MSRGKFITIEGGEGAGKSTQAARLAEALRARGHGVLATREPGGSPGAEEIRRLLVSGHTDRWDPISEALLHVAARRDHVVKTLRPALERGEWVVCDRFTDSTVAYQGHGHGLGRDFVDRLHGLALEGFAPDLTIILDLPVADGLARAASRGGDDRYERMDGGFHERLREGFLETARREPSRCVVIDASGDAEAVHADVLVAVTERLGDG